MTRYRFLPVFFLVMVFLGLEIATRLFEWPLYLWAAPSDVAKTLYVDAAPLWTAFFETASSALIGFCFAVVIGTSIGIALSLSRTLEAIFYPYAVFFQTVPIIAIAPLLVIWFGYGYQTVAISSMIVSVFPILAATLAGFRATDQQLMQLFSLYTKSTWTILLKLRAPLALPQIFVGLRIAAGLSVIGAIVGEFIAGGGLGGWIDVARKQQQVDQVFAAVGLSAAFAWILIQVIRIVQTQTLRHWHPSEKSL